MIASNEFRNLLEIHSVDSHLAYTLRNWSSSSQYSSHSWLSIWVWSVCMCFRPSRSEECGWCSASSHLSIWIADWVMLVVWSLCCWVEWLRIVDRVLFGEGSHLFDASEFYQNLLHCLVSLNHSPSSRTSQLRSEGQIEWSSSRSHLNLKNRFRVVFRYRVISVHKVATLETDLTLIFA